MNHKNQKVLMEIQKKTLDPIRKQPIFRTPDEVIETALNLLLQNLKNKKMV